jgi:hypothetical protein
MAEKSLEERIQHLEELNRSQQKEMERLKAVHEIQNLMGRYSFFHTAGMQEETTQLWARKTPGIRADVPSFGLYEGFEGIKRLYIGAHNYFEGDRIGQMHMHTLTTPVIEVAGDGKTAKGVWISPGQETGLFDGKLQAFWAWLKYGADFVKEDGQWKLWHLRVYGIFFTPYEKSWVEASLPPREVVLPDEVKPDRYTTYFTSYSPTGRCELIPAPPEPYETFDEKTAYGKE